ncbi:putative SANT/Myb domain, Homeobox-like domain superfamily protein [Helianthus annuus]|nr:putative SANT/Myb domain, Homeobox-like domain superfamily protein [Helianthus annuus]
MVQKRQLYGEEYDVSTKHLKLEHNCDLVPCLQFTKDDAQLQSDKDVGCIFKPYDEVENGFVSGKFTDHPVCATKDVDCTLPGRLSTSSWASSTVTEEDALSEAVPPSTPNAYSYLLERPPMKQVSVGPEYQAEIPEWHGSDGDEIKFLGSTVIPMPENQTIHDSATDASAKTECYCQNPGSAECVKQHIKESRETLKARIGLEAFMDLGFGDMGEVVAEKWTEDDEHLFHEVVYSNPVSSGRNFWNHLAAEFPSRSSQEIVSYYFNVFMLRRRTEQNRLDPMNADSDDDESPEYDSEPRKLHDSCFHSTSEKTIVDESGDGGHDFLYDSCTSSDTVGAPCTSKLNTSWVNHEFNFEPLDPRVWDVGYFSCARTKTEFLPTGSMIEEVFGVEPWDFETTDDNKSSN